MLSKYSIYKPIKQYQFIYDLGKSPQLLSCRKLQPMNLSAAELPERLHASREISDSNEARHLDKCNRPQKTKLVIA